LNRQHTRPGFGLPPQSNHAVRAAIDEALRCNQEGVAHTILFNLSGHGNFDMQAYADYLAGKLDDLKEARALLDEPHR
jgi:tryptophan synthase beta chain